ncbi:S-type pyocin domain-containing protein [Morganella morganii]|uniref:S-type pyocin domain-containing protein n=2 Tax=Morganella morganii TaxID=582 RepID=UPI0028D8DDCA|nr:S-type pyocin domain-containing protein [Morganella morganii]WNP29193.1 S-type pyocin domain-containing protein [Morganella morganii]
MSDIRDCINCENYRYWLEIQLVDDAGHPLDNMSFTLKERGTDKSLSGVTDGQGLFRVDGLSARPVMVTINAQDLADKLTTSMPLQSVYYPDDSLKNWCRTQGYILSEHNNAGMFNTVLPERIYDMSPAQIARLHEYSACHDGYTFVWPYNQRRVVSIRRITEKVFAKSVLRGAGNTDAGTAPEMLDNFGRHSHARKAEQTEPVQAGFPLVYLAEMIISAIVGGAVYNQTTQNTRRNDDDLFSPGSTARSEKSQRNFMLTLVNNALPVGVLMANYYEGDSLTYEDLAEKARAGGTATTRVRIRYQENTETGRPDVMSFATEGNNDQVRVRMGEKAPEFEANEIRNSSQAYSSSDGLPTPQSLATIYKFTLDDGHILYLGVGTDNKFVELASSTHPDDFGGRGWHTGGDIEPVDVPTNTGNHNPHIPERPDSSGGFQAHDDNGPVILTTPAPGEQDFNDYILITPIPDIPAIYVYLSEELPGLNRPARDASSDYPPNQAVLDKMNDPKYQDLLNNDNYDCSEIADRLLEAADGAGYIIEVQPVDKFGEITILENGVSKADMTYHQVYTDGKYIYDPRLSKQAIPKGDWEKHIKSMNNDNPFIISNKPKGLNR